MEERIRVQFNSETFGLEEYETESIFKSTAWLIAVQNGHEGGLAQEIAELCNLIWLEIDDLSIGEFAIVDYVVKNYHDLPEDYKEIKYQILEENIWGD